MYIAVNIVTQDNGHDYGEYIWRKIKNQEDSTIHPILKDILSTNYGNNVEGEAPYYTIGWGSALIRIDSFIFFNRKKELVNFLVDRTKG